MALRYYIAIGCALFGVSLGVSQGFGQTPGFVRGADRVRSTVATLQAFGYPTLEGRWFFAGPFDYSGEDAFDRALPPDRGTTPEAQYRAPDGSVIRWQPWPKFQLGQVQNLKPLFPGQKQDHVAVYLLHEFEAKAAFTWTLSLGSDDSLSVILNGKRIHHEDYSRPAGPDQDLVDLPVQAGKNQLLIKIGQYAGNWEVYVAPTLPRTIPQTVRAELDKLFPAVQQASPASSQALEAKYYAVDTFSLPEECVLEVGGLGFRPDGSLLISTRRGEIWRADNITASNPLSASFQKVASGLHEALGLHILDDKQFLVAQRPELTKITLSEPRGPATRFETLCDRWGVSGDYHEYCFGPAVDAQGNAFLTLNVGFGGGHQAKAAWRGWCVKVRPDGTMEPFAYGLRSPNGINFSPEGELFYSDNQGEWVATNKLHHVRRGQFYGHQASLKWLKESPFANEVTEPKNRESRPSGQRYDGVNPKNPEGPKVYPPHDPPTIWFPYGRMGQSITEPRWDTSRGGFGPFAGQMFIGDQTRSMVMRVALESVNGVYQGACFPFRSGLQCGANRLVFGPDGSLYVGQTARGWGSTGGKPYGLQRIRFLGVVPPEILSLQLTRTGFKARFTQPIDPASLTPTSLDLKSFTYVYHPAYGCPETDTSAETVQNAKLSEDGLELTFDVPRLAKGRVYELQLSGWKTRTGEPLLHEAAYYTLNERLP